MCSHILDITIKRILVKSEIERAIKVLRRYRLDQISEIDCDNCFQISEADLRIKSSFKSDLINNKTALFFDFTSVILSIISKTLRNMKSKLFNDIMLYDDKKTTKTYIKLFKKFSTLWEDREFIDVLENDWMRILLKDNWQTKVTDKSKIYSLRIKNRQVLNKIFDDLHKKDRLKWTDTATSFSYLVFVTWKTVNEERKNRAIVDIRELNDFIFLTHILYLHNQI